MCHYLLDQPKHRRKCSRTSGLFFNGRSGFIERRREAATKAREKERRPGATTDRRSSQADWDSADRQKSGRIKVKQRHWPIRKYRLMAAQLLFDLRACNARPNPPGF